MPIVCREQCRELLVHADPLRVADHLELCKRLRRSDGPPCQNRAKTPLNSQSESNLSNQASRRQAPLVTWRLRSPCGHDAAQCFQAPRAVLATQEAAQLAPPMQQLAWR